MPRSGAKKPLRVFAEAGLNGPVRLRDGEFDDSEADGKTLLRINGIPYMLGDLRIYLRIGLAAPDIGERLKQ